MRKILHESDLVRTGPGTLAGKYLRTYWQPVFRARDLQAGSAVPIRIMGEDFTLYREEGGQPHVVGFRCAHRGAQLSTGWIEDDCIRCPYHGWKYNGTGQCVEQPAEDEAFAKKIRIAGYPTEEYLGLVFAYLGENRAPPLERFPEFEDEGVLTVDRFPRRCNFFNDLENTVDPAHTPFTHRNSTIAINGQIDLKRISAEESEWGITVSTWRPAEIASDHDGGLRLHYFGMPNKINLLLPPLSELENGWRNMLSWRVPVDDEQYLTFSVYLVRVSAENAAMFAEPEPELLAKGAALMSQVVNTILSGQLKREDRESRFEALLSNGPESRLEPDESERLMRWVRHRGLTYLQDGVNFIGQGTFADRAREHLGRSDVGTILLRKLWTRELRALAEGRPLKKWVRPDHLLPTTGVRSELRPGANTV